MITPDGEYSVKILGDMLVDKDASYQVLVVRGLWFAAELADTSSYALVSAIVAPGNISGTFELFFQRYILDVTVT